MPQDVQNLQAILLRAPVIPVLILDDPATARPLAEALVAGGLPVIEITLRSANALSVAAEMAKVEGAVVGAGTLRTAEQMRQSVDAGCRFMVSPGAAPRLMQAAEAMPIPLLPGIASPTEAMTAAEMGYQFLKFFPAEALGGPAVLKAFASPFPDLKFCPTGGVGSGNAGDYLQLPNVVCVGGSWVVPKEALESGDFARIESLAREAAGLRG